MAVRFSNVGLRVFDTCETVQQLLSVVKWYLKNCIFLTQLLSMLKRYFMMSYSWDYTSFIVNCQTLEFNPSIHEAI